MALVRVASLGEVPANSVIEVQIGSECYAICNVGGRVTALAGTCPHSGGPLGQGAIHGENVVCPWHAWEFNCSTGEHDYNPSIKVARYEVEVRGEDVYLDVL